MTPKTSDAFPFIAERIAYGRRIRDEAAALVRSHGSLAFVVARKTAHERTDPADRHFQEAVAERIARHFASKEGRRQADGALSNAAQTQHKRSLR